jgi:hypothetical protein
MVHEGRDALAALVARGSVGDRCGLGVEVRGEIAVGGQFLPRPWLRSRCLR